MDSRVLHNPYVFLVNLLGALLQPRLGGAERAQGGHPPGVNTRRRRESFRRTAT